MGNSKSTLRRLRGVLPVYFSSEWSFAQFRVQDYRCIAAFGAEANTIIIVCGNGEMVREEFIEFHYGVAPRERPAEESSETSEAGQSNPEKVTRGPSTFALRHPGFASATDKIDTLDDEPDAGAKSA